MMRRMLIFIILLALSGFAHAATITAAQTGNWSATATWTGGVLPGAGDVAEANGKTVTIDQDVTVTSLTTASGGGFACSTTRTINAQIHAVASTCLAFSGINGTILTIIGGVYAGAGPNYVGIYCTSSGVINITGDVHGGSGGSSSNPAAGVSNGSSGIINITGNAYAGTIGGSYGLYNSSTGIINLTGNSHGGAIATARGSYNAATGSINISGNACAGTVTDAQGAYNNAGGALQVSGLAIGNGYGAGSTGLTPCEGVFGSQNGVTIVGGIQYGSRGMSPTAGVVRVVDSTANIARMVLYDGSNTTKTLVDSAATVTWPSAADVRYGTTFDSGNRTGTLRVPAASQVAYGVPVDAGTGTAVLTGSGVWGYAERTLTSGAAPTSVTLAAAQPYYAPAKATDIPTPIPTPNVPAALADYGVAKETKQDDIRTSQGTILMAVQAIEGGTGGGASAADIWGYLVDGSVSAETALKRLLAAVYNSANVTGTADKTIHMFASDGATTVGHQLIYKAGAGRVTTNE